MYHTPLRDTTPDDVENVKASLRGSVVGYSREPLSVTVCKDAVPTKMIDGLCVLTFKVAYSSVNGSYRFSVPW